MVCANARHRRVLAARSPQGDGGTSPLGLCPEGVLVADILTAALVAAAEATRARASPSSLTTGSFGPIFLP